MRAPFVISFLILSMWSCSRKTNTVEPYLKNNSSQRPASVSNNIANVPNYAATFVMNGTCESVRSAATNPAIQKLIQYNVAIYRITYPTKDNNDHAITASGTVFIPMSSSASACSSVVPANGFPMLSYQHMSLMGDNEVYQSSFNNQQIYQFAASGYITAVPDYIGFNASDGIQHPYLNSKCSFNAVKDMLEAVKLFTNAQNVKRNGQLFLYGFSQGGNATLAALKGLEKTPVAELTLTATAAGSGAFALRSEMAYLLNQYYLGNAITTTLFAYLVYGYSQNLPSPTAPAYYFKSPYATLIPSYMNGSTPLQACTQGMYNFMNAAPSSNKIVFNESFLNAAVSGADVSFNNFLDNNTLHNWAPQTRLQLYHGSTDEVIPTQNTLDTYNTMTSAPYNASKDKVSYLCLTAANHGAASQPIFENAIIWFLNYKQ